MLPLFMNPRWGRIEKRDIVIFSTFIGTSTIYTVSSVAVSICKVTHTKQRVDINEIIYLVRFTDSVCASRAVQVSKSLQHELCFTVHDHCVAFLFGNHRLSFKDRIGSLLSCHRNLAARHRTPLLPSFCCRIVIENGTTGEVPVVNSFQVFGILAVRFSIGGPGKARQRRGCRCGKPIRQTGPAVFQELVPAPLFVASITHFAASSRTSSAWHRGILVKKPTMAL